jgi:hypothetical protein
MDYFEFFIVIDTDIKSCFGLNVLNYSLQKLTTMISTLSSMQVMMTMMTAVH